MRFHQDMFATLAHNQIMYFLRNGDDDDDNYGDCCLLTKLKFMISAADTYLMANTKVFKFKAQKTFQRGFSAYRLDLTHSNSVQ